MKSDSPPLEALPAGIRLETLETQAEELVKAADAGEPAALGDGEPPESLTREQAKRVVAGRYGFDGWRELKSYLAARDDLLVAQSELEAFEARMQAGMKPSGDLENRLGAAKDKAEGLLLRMHGIKAGDGAARPRSCSFCTKPQYEVKNLLAFAKGHICNECLDLCVQILRDDGHVVPQATNTSPSAA